MTAPLLSSRPRLLLRGLVLIVVFVVLGLVLRAVEQNLLLNVEWIDGQIRNQGLTGQLIFLGAGVVFISFGLPRQALCFLGGYAFGLLGGTVISLTATVIGCAVTFAFARFMAGDFVAARLPERLRKADGFFGTHPFSLTLLIRLLPVGSNLATNLVAGLSSASPLPFLAASALGHFPQTVIFVLIGSGINVDPESRITLGAILFAVSLLTGVYLYNRFRSNEAFAGAIDAVVGNGSGNANEAGGALARAAETNGKN